jgi:hypothetical protein
MSWEMLLGQRRGNRGSNGELPDRHLLGLCLTVLARADRPGVVPAESWTDDRDRCRAAGIPDEVATKPRQAIAMVNRALQAACRRLVHRR